MISRNFSYPSNKSFFLLGPRGTGKSLFVKTQFPQAIYINLLQDELYQSLLSNPSRLADLIPTSHRDWVAIDEIQKIPSLLDEVHRLIEERRLKFILTGSSARKLKRSGVNLLAGRAFMKHAHPLTALELGSSFDINRALRSGLLPQAYLEKDYRDYLAAYVSAYLKEEVQQEGLVRNLGSFARFLEAASFSQGQILNYSNISADSSVERKTVTNFFELLQDLLLADSLDVFSLRAKRELIKHRKFYYFDVGVFNQLRPRGPLDSIEEIQGPAVETLVYQELRARNEYQAWDYKIFFWHTKNHMEVDFVLYGERGFHAIEVKSGVRLRDTDFNGLLEFKKDYPKSNLIFVYGGTEPKTFKDIKIVPIRDFLLKTDRWIG